MSISSTIYYVVTSHYRNKVLNYGAKLITAQIHLEDDIVHLKTLL